MKKLGPQGIKVLKIVHLFFAVLWIGGAIGLLAILFLANPTNGDELYMSSRISQIVDDFFSYSRSYWKLFYWNCVWSMDKLGVL